jgi:hypothetical protein
MESHEESKLRGSFGGTAASAYGSSRRPLRKHICYCIRVHALAAAG